MSTDLSPVEQQTLTEFESVIERGIGAFVEVGRSLAAIRDDRLYRKSHGTFEAYCQERWGFNDRRARQMIEAAAIGTSGTDPSPANERQARELSGLDAGTAAGVMHAAHDQAERSGGKVTASAIREAREQVAPKPEGGTAPAPPPAPQSSQPPVTLRDKATQGVKDFPDLAYYADDATVVRLAEALRGYPEPERTRRVGILAQTVAAEKRREDQPVEDTGPDYSSMADDIFTACNKASRVIAANGGPDTIAAAMPYAHQIEAANWHNEFESLAAACTVLAAACKPSLRRIK